MPKKQAKPKYPKDIIVGHLDDEFCVYETPKDAFINVMDDILSVEVAIYQFVRIGKVKRTVTVE